MDRTVPRLAALLALVLASYSFAFAAGVGNGWTRYGRGSVEQIDGSIVVKELFLVDNSPLADGEISFVARAPQGESSVQIWSGFRCKNRDTRYVLALRGGDNQDLYLARYSPDGNDLFLALARLDFAPKVGQWYALRVLMKGNRFQVYLNDEKLPRINVADPNPIASGACVLGGGWLRAEFKEFHSGPLSAQGLQQFEAAGKKRWEPPTMAGDEKTRSEQRAAYRPITVASLSSPRCEIPLEGQWLFLPVEPLPAEQEPASAQSPDDRDWHVIDVPNFWTPMLNWLYGEEGNMPGGKGISDKLLDREMTRVRSYTFDWKKTQAAWYRQHVQLPADLSGRRFELCFDAVAKIATVYVNGQKVAYHVGMFGEIVCDVTAALRPGDNVVAVHVLRNLPRKKKDAPNKIEGVAESVEVTSEMLRSLPHGIFTQDPAGIWQGVKLRVSPQLRVSNVFLQPRTDGTAAKLQLANDSGEPCTVDVSYSIRSAADSSVLFRGGVASNVALAAGGETELALDTPKLSPKLWAPWSPNLYYLDVELARGGRVVDRHSTRFGFRTFTVEGNRLVLNGRPLWLRGGTHFALALRPNDRELAIQTMRTALAGNVFISRSCSGAHFQKTRCALSRVVKIVLRARTSFCKSGVRG